MIPRTARVKGSRQHPDLFRETGITGITRELGCCGTGFTGLSAAGWGAGIFFPISSALLAGRTRAGLAGAGLEVPGIFLAISSVLLDGLTRECTACEASAGTLILAATSSALLTRLRPVLSFIAIIIYS